MSDSEASGRQTDSEDLTDQEDVVEQSSVVQPYMFEPEATGDYQENEADEDGIYREALENRYLKTLVVSSWYVNLQTKFVALEFVSIISLQLRI